MIAPSGNATPGKIRAPWAITLSAPTVTPSPSTAPPVIRGACADATAGRDDAVAQPAALADLRPVEDHRALDRRARADRDVFAEHDQAADLGALGDAHAALEHRRRDHATGDLGALVDRQPVAAQALADGRLHVALDDVEGALQVALGRADVQPVALRGKAVEALADQQRPHLALDRDVAIGRHELEDLALQHVRAGADQVRVDRIRARLLDEVAHRAVLVEMHEAVGARVGDRHERERRLRAGPLVLGDLRAQVDVREHVAVEHQEALVEHRLGELQRAGRAARVGLLDEAQADPQPGAVAEHVAHARREKAAGHDHVVDPVLAQPLEHERDERPVDQRHDGLGHGRGQRAQPRALAADEDHGLHQPPRRAARLPRPTPS